MKFDELDTNMRVYETASDQCVLPNMYMVARLDGRSFTHLTKRACNFDAPFDQRFNDLMVLTARSLMCCGFKVIYAYTESDEISLLFDLHEQRYGRKLRKYNSTLAAEASAIFSIKLGQPACFDCRVSQLPNSELVVDYFRWRQEDAIRNALNAWCYWTLRKHGFTAQQSTARMHKMSRSEKNELLYQLGVNFNDLPLWQRRGVALYWTTRQLKSRDPRDNKRVDYTRSVICTDSELPCGDSYSSFVRDKLLSKPSARAR